MRTVRSVAGALGLGFEGDGDIALASAAHPAAAGPEDLALAMDPKYLNRLGEGRARAAMTPEGADWRGLGLEAAIFAPRARYAMAGVTKLFAPPRGATPGRHPTALVAEDAEIAEDASIGPFAIVEAGAVVGPRVEIGAHASVGAGARLGEDGVYKAGVRIARGVVVGARAFVHENAVIGSDGFSFVTPEKGAVEIARAGGADPFAVDDAVWTRIYSLGGVEIGDDVEIGACATIDRGTVAKTRIGSGTKIDNLVQIGHNVVIGESCMLCGQAGVAGSAELGDRVVLGGQAGVADHTVVGHDVLIMASSGVSGVVKPRQIMGGSPAAPKDEAVKLYMATRKLPKLIEDVAALKKRFSKAEGSG